MIKQLLPPSLAQDENIRALTEALDKELQNIESQIINVLILPRIDQIEDEEFLDLLAWQFHIEGYELAQSIEEKRNLIKKAVKLHRYKGTKYAIEEVLRALNLEGQVNEWFEYGGQPYHFSVDVLLYYKGLSEDTYTKLRSLVEQYKNVRSKLETIRVYATASTSQFRSTATFGGYEAVVHPYQTTDITLQSVAHRGTGYQSVETTTLYPLGG